MKAPIKHLWTGITVCGELRSWCRDPILRTGAKVHNATDKPEDCTCQPCLAEYRKALEGWELLTKTKTKAKERP